MNGKHNIQTHFQSLNEQTQDKIDLLEEIRIRSNRPIILKFNDEEKHFILTPRTILDFKRGLLVPSKLIPKQIQGGTLLVNTTYEMR